MIIGEVVVEHKSTRRAHLCPWMDGLAGPRLFCPWSLRWCRRSSSRKADAKASGFSPGTSGTIADGTFFRFSWPSMISIQAWMALIASPNCCACACFPTVCHILRSREIVWLRRHWPTISTYTSMLSIGCIHYTILLIPRQSRSSTQTVAESCQLMMLREYCICCHRRQGHRTPKTLLLPPPASSIVLAWSRRPLVIPQPVDIKIILGIMNITTSIWPHRSMYALC